MTQRLTFLLVLAFLAAGCGGRNRPSSFASCGRSHSHSLDYVLPTTYDCLAHASRGDCRPVQASFAEMGVDTSATYRLRLYRSGGRCMADVLVHSHPAIGPRNRTYRADCRAASVVSRRTLTLFDCGDLRNVSVTRGEACHLPNRPVPGFACPARVP